MFVQGSDCLVLTGTKMAFSHWLLRVQGMDIFHVAVAVTFLNNIYRRTVFAVTFHCKLATKSALEHTLFLLTILLVP